MSSKEKKHLKRLKQEIGKIEKSKYEIDYKNLKYYVCKTGIEIDCSELENRYLSWCYCANKTSIEEALNKKEKFD